MTVTLLFRPYAEQAAHDLVEPDPGTTAADHAGVIAGRECYASQGRPNPATAADRDYLANVIRQAHESVLAHASFTFRIECSRSCSHELIRSRFLAFSEVSQRYVAMDRSATVVPPLFRGDDYAEREIEDHHDDALIRYRSLVELAEDRLAKQGVTGPAARKRAREAARAVLPGGTGTALIVTGNVRAWRDFIAQRNTVHADAEIREVAVGVLELLHRWAPYSVADLVAANRPDAS